MTHDDVPIVAEIIQRTVAQAIAAERVAGALALERAVRPLCERLASLEARPPVPGPPGEKGAPGADGAPGRDGLDGKAGLEYCGVWIEGRSYDRGELATYAGSTWHCNEATTTRPGDGAKAWTLMVKRGRDGKDGRP